MYHIFFRTMSGIIGTTKELVESWKLDQTCAVMSIASVDESEPCKGHKERQEWASSSCSLITSLSDDNPFKPCIERLDTTQIQKAHVECMYDACNCDRGGDCECLCR